MLSHEVYNYASLPKNFADYTYNTIKYWRSITPVYRVLWRSTERPNRRAAATRRLWEPRGARRPWRGRSGGQRNLTLDRTKRTNNVFENSVRIVVVDFAHVSASYSRHGCKNVTPYNIIYRRRFGSEENQPWALYGPTDLVMDLESTLGMRAVSRLVGTKDFSADLIMTAAAPENGV